MNPNPEQRKHRLLIVSNRLPLSIERRGDDYQTRPSVGGLASSLRALSQDQEMLWIGWPGINIAKRDEQAQIADDLRTNYGCEPLYIPQSRFRKYYAGLSNACIWPLFHYFPQHAHFDQNEWHAYRQVNLMFREKVLQIVQPGDRIWIHDYHLMLLPSMIRTAFREAKIGFFLHIPFPSYEIFRMLPWREEILRGLIGSDLIGFHSYSYARHFVSSLLRILGLEQEFGKIMVGDRTIKVDTFPLGVDVDRFASALEINDVKTGLKDLHIKTEGRKVILSVDRLDFTKGILERLRAFEQFLRQHSNWRNRVTLISLCVPSRTSVPEYQKLKREVDELVGRINGRFGQPGWTPIWYLYRSLPFESLVSLYKLADVALVTPLRDGMNLVAKEYIASRPEGSGVLVLSETAGAAEELGEAIIVNPFDQKEIVHALHEALKMPLSEQKMRNKPMLSRLRRYDIARWSDDFLHQLENSLKERAALKHKHLIGKELKHMVDHYQGSPSRLLLLDYDGTLIPFASRPDGASPDPDLLKILGTLAADPRNTVVIISGRDHVALENWFAETGVEMVAEHGARKWSPQTSSWQLFDETISDDWMKQLREMLDVYVDRTPGASLEIKGKSLAWHYRRAEPEMGTWRAKELIDTLEGFVANTPLQVIHGNKVVEIRQSILNKGQAAQEWLEPETDFEFKLAIGDDVTDEDLFGVMPSGSWTVRVGRSQQSNARYFLPDPAAVRHLLEDLIAADE